LSPRAKLANLHLFRPFCSLTRSKPQVVIVVTERLGTIQTFRRKLIGQDYGGRVEGDHLESALPSGADIVRLSIPIRGRSLSGSRVALISKGASHAIQDARPLQNWLWNKGSQGFRLLPGQKPLVRGVPDRTSFRAAPIGRGICLDSRDWGLVVARPRWIRRMESLFAPTWTLGAAPARTHGGTANEDSGAWWSGAAVLGAKIIGGHRDRSFGARGCRGLQLRAQSRSRTKTRPCGAWTGPRVCRARADVPEGPPE